MLKTLSNKMLHNNNGCRKEQRDCGTSMDDLTGWTLNSGLNFKSNES